MKLKYTIFLKFFFKRVTLLTTDPDYVLSTWLHGRVFPFSFLVIPSHELKLFKNFKSTRGQCFYLFIVIVDNKFIVFTYTGKLKNDWEKYPAYFNKLAVHLVFHSRNLKRNARSHGRSYIIKISGLWLDLTFWSTDRGIVCVLRQRTTLESPQLDAIIWQPDRTTTEAVDPTISGATASESISLSVLSKLLANTVSHFLCHSAPPATSRFHSSAITSCIRLAQNWAT